MQALTIAHEIKQIEGREIHVLRPQGAVDVQTFPLFEDALMQLVADGHYHIQIDFEKLTAINSTALGLIMATWRQVHQHGGSLIVDTRQASDKLRNLLTLLGMRFDDDDSGCAGVAVRRPPPGTPSRGAENKRQRPTR